VVGTGGRGHLFECLVGQGGPAVGVCMRYGDPLLERPSASAGVDAVCTVVEVAPWSRIPETRAILVPQDD